MLAKVIIISVLAIATSHAFPGRIVGGHDAPLVGFEHQISLRHGNVSHHKHVCGASVLSSRWILTAGHCITEVPQKPGTSYYAVAGIHNLAENGQEVHVKRIVIHPDFLGGINPNDIAIMELEEELVLNDKVKAVQLPQKDSIPSGIATLSGWGSMSLTTVPIYPQDLQTIDLPILTITECVNALVEISGSADPLDDTNVCIGPIDDGGEGSCSGDSGGPLVIRQGDNVVQIGIVSWGFSPCGIKGAPSVLTQVSSFIDFINEHVQ